MNLNNSVTRMAVDKNTNVYFILNKNLRTERGLYWRILVNGELLFIANVPNFGYMIEKDGVSRTFHDIYEALDYFDSLLSHEYGVDLMTHA